MYQQTLPFTIRARRRDQVAVLDLEGDLVLGPSLIAFRHHTRAALSGPAPALLILNMGRVSRLDSSGLGELFLLHSSASPLGVKLALAGAQPRVMELLSVTRMNAIFPSFPDERGALDSLAASASSASS